ncbi:MAG: D-2-hydroxyacid dehydrogenase [Betaproteobacteria bacterium]
MPHLHIENNSRASALSHIREPQVHAARERHPGLRKLQVTIGWDADILDEALKSADYLIASRPPREHLRQRAPKLSWIQTTGAGVDHLLPLDWLPPDIVLTNNSGPHGPRCEDFCTMALLALWQRLPRLVHQQRERHWNSIFTRPIAGRTCVVIGYGDLGQAAVRAAKKLGLRAIAVTRSGKGAGPADEVVVSSAVEAVLPRADFVIVAAPLTPETRDFMSRRRLALLRPEAGLVNVARAPLVDYAALADMLRDGRLSGAILDVHDPEPLPPESPLWSVPNLMLTPHISCDDPRYADMLLDAWAANFARLDAGEGLRNVVDRTRGY